MKILNFQDYVELNEYNIDWNALIQLKEQLEHIDESEVDDKLQEGFIGTLLGAGVGSWLLPKIGKIIAKVLGVEKGLLFNFLTSNFVGAALGAEIMKNKE